MTTRRMESFLVFLSHLSRESPLANRIATILDSIGLPTFVYGKYRIGGQNRFEVIKSQITTSPYFALLLTRKACSSMWVNQEIGFAAALGKPIIPLVETSPTLQRRIPYSGFVELSDPIDLATNDPKDAIGELLRTLMVYAKGDKRWSGWIRLTCQCGNTRSYRHRDLSQWNGIVPTVSRSCQCLQSHSNHLFLELSE